MDKLTGVHPRLIDTTTAIIAAMRELDFRMIVTDGVRTSDEQAALYAKGRTAPGPIVTNADGVTHRSNHQPHADGYGHAVDMCFLTTGGAASWASSWPWRLYGEMAKAKGCSWGGEWKAITDQPHIEWPDA